MARIEKVIRIITKTNTVEEINIETLEQQTYTVEELFDAKGQMFVLNLKLLEKYLLKQLENINYKRIFEGKMQRKQFRSTSVPELGLIELRTKKHSSQTTMRPFELKFLAEVSELRAIDKRYESMSDLEVAADMIKQAYKQDLVKSTLSQDAVASWKETNFDGRNDKAKEYNFRVAFPKLSIDNYNFARKAYFGGWCYLSETGAKYKGAGRTYDVNSLYPSVMHGEHMPIGEPVVVKGAPRQTVQILDKQVSNTLYITNFKVNGLKLNKGYYPFVVSEENRLAKGRKRYDLGGQQEFTMTNVEFELFQEAYTWESIQYIETHHYVRSKDFYSKYIDKWMEVKANSTGSLRQLAKLMLNNLYGRFGYKIHKTQKGFDETGSAERLSKTDERSMVYLPTAIFTTAYGRIKTVRAANANYDNFLYADTDSIHIKNSYKKQNIFQKLFRKTPELEEVKGIEVHESKLGAWKLELEFTESDYLGLKTYREFDGEKWHYTVAGLPSATVIKDEEFAVGSEIPIIKKIQTESGWKNITETFTFKSER